MNLSKFIALFLLIPVAQIGLSGSVHIQQAHKPTESWAKSIDSESIDSESFQLKNASFELFEDAFDNDSQAVEKLYKLGKKQFLDAIKAEQVGDQSKATMALAEARKNLVSAIDKTQIFAHSAEETTSNVCDPEFGFTSDSTGECLTTTTTSSSSITQSSDDILFATQSFQLLQKIYIKQASTGLSSAHRLNRLNSAHRMTNVPNDSLLIEALMASEHARALHIDSAIVENTNVIDNFFEDTPDSKTEEFFNKIYTQRSTIDDLKSIASTEEAWIVNYSVGPHDYLEDFNSSDSLEVVEPYLYIWLISPDGKVSFVNQTQALSEFEQELGDRVVADCQTNPNAAGCRADRISGMSQGVRGVRQSINVQARGKTDTTVEEAVLNQKRQLAELYSLLISPIADLLPDDAAQRVVIVPDGALHFVPFAALINPTTQKHFIEEHTLVHAPSFRSLLLSRNNRIGQLVAGRRPIQEVLVAGNPEMPMLSGNAGRFLGQLEPLPGAEQEAKDVTEMLSRNYDFTTRLLLNREASETAIVERMRNAQIVHFATHGIIDSFSDIDAYEFFINGQRTSLSELEDMGLFEPAQEVRELLMQVRTTSDLVNSKATGSIVLSASDSHDGLLESTEIAQMNLRNTELVVLSACNTGRGNLTPGGAIGLPFAFNIAGVPSAVVSLWAVEDESTAEFMTIFYDELLSDPSLPTLNKAKALRTTMLKMLEKYPNSPRNWAAFTLVGTPD